MVSQVWGPAVAHSGRSQMHIHGLSEGIPCLSWDGAVALWKAGPVLLGHDGGTACLELH